MSFAELVLAICFAFFALNIVFYALFLIFSRSKAVELRRHLPFQFAALFVLGFAPLFVDRIAEFLTGEAFAEAATSGMEAFRASEATLFYTISGILTGVLVLTIVVVSVAVAGGAPLVAAVVAGSPLVAVAGEGVAHVVSALSIFLMINMIAVTFARIMIISWYYIFAIGVALYCLPAGIGRSAGKFFMIFSIASVVLIAAYQRLADYMHAVVAKLVGDAAVELAGALTLLLVPPDQAPAFMAMMAPLVGPLDLGRVVLAPILFLGAIAMLTAGFVGAYYGPFSHFAPWVGGLRGFKHGKVIMERVNPVPYLMRFVRASERASGIIADVHKQIVNMRDRLHAARLKLRNLGEKVADKIMADVREGRKMSEEMKARTPNPYQFRMLGLQIAERTEAWDEEGIERIDEIEEEFREDILHSKPYPYYWNPEGIRKLVPIPFVAKVLQPYYAKLLGFLERSYDAELRRRLVAREAYPRIARTERVYSAVLAHKGKLKQFVVEELAKAYVRRKRLNKAELEALRELEKDSRAMRKLESLACNMPLERRRDFDPFSLGRELLPGIYRLKDEFDRHVRAGYGKLDFVKVKLARAAKEKYRKMVVARAGELYPLVSPVLALVKRGLRRA